MKNLEIILMIQYQLIQDHMEEGNWFNSKEVFVKDSELQNNMLDVFGMYWHIIVKVTNHHFLKDF